MWHYIMAYGYDKREEKSASLRSCPIDLRVRKATRQLQELVYNQDKGEV